MDGVIDSDGLIALLGTIFLIVRGYGALFAPYQMEFSEAVFAWFGTPSERKPIYNFAIGTAIAAALTTVAAVYFDDWRLLIVSLVAGFFASTDAAKAHDTAKVQAAGMEASVVADEAYEQGRRDAIAAVRQRQQMDRRADPRRPA